MRKGYQLLLSVCVGLIVTLGGTSALAALSTSDSLDMYNAKQAYFETYNQEYKAPTSISEAGEEHIMTTEGTLGYRANDLTLPGKGGLDLEINRRYNSGEVCEVGGEISLYNVMRSTVTDYSNTKKDVYVYYVNGDKTTEPVYVVFDNEAALLETEEDGAIYTSSDYTESSIGWGENALNYYIDISDSEKIRAFKRATAFTMELACRREPM